MEQIALAQLIEQARSTWPELALDSERFAKHLRARVADGDAADAPQGGVVLHPADLYLAFACGEGNASAIEQFDATYGAELSRLASRFANRSLSTEDLVQTLRAKLFVEGPSDPARIREYSGRGTLRAWLRVAALRTYLDATKRGRGREVGLPSAMELPGDVDPELDFLKAHYRAHFKSAFVAAVASLTREQRNLLRLRVLSGLTAEQIAAVLGVHRATTDRHLVQARQDVLHHTRRELMARLAVDGDEFDQIMGLIQSRLEVSLPRLLTASLVTPSGGRRA